MSQRRSNVNSDTPVASFQPSHDSTDNVVTTLRNSQSESSRHTPPRISLPENPFMPKFMPPNRTQNYCYRHHPDVSCNRQADAAQMIEIQQSLDQLDKADREAISHVWRTFSAAPAFQRNLILQGILAQCCFPQLSQVSTMLRNVIRIDFISALPAEISFKILTYLDSKSLCRATQVCRAWKQMADDDIVWHRLCEQHIDKKCTKCGWGLPLLEKKRLRERRRAIEAQQVSATQDASECSASRKRGLQGETITIKRRKTRPWKEVYAERYYIEANWRNGRYRSLEFKHQGNIAVLTLQFCEQYLITGTDSGAIVVWDIETGLLLRSLTGHLRAVNALKFDNSKLISGSSDRTVRVWNYKTGECVCTFRGHDDEVLCIDFDDKLIASGSKDTNIKVWNFQTKSCFFLRGHSEWVYSVKIQAASNTLFSSSEDATIRMWDLETKQCVKVFSAPGSQDAHVAQITSILPLFIDSLEADDTSSNHEDEDTAVSDTEVEPRSPVVEEDDRNMFDSSIGQRRASEASETLRAVRQAFENSVSVDPERPKRPTHLLSASLDSTIKIWNVKSGRCVRTLFGHIEGIWSVDADTFRVVSGSHDKLVKVWDLQSGRNWHTFSGHCAPVCCVGLSDTKLASGSEDGLVRMLCFDDFGNDSKKRRSVTTGTGWSD